MPEMVLISVDLPAPLSPTIAVTCPAGTSRSMSASARTGPKFLPMPRRLSSGGSCACVPPEPAPLGSVACCAGDGARPAGAAGRAPSAPVGVVTGSLRAGGGNPASDLDPVRRAGGREGARAQLLRRHELVFDDR